MANDLAGRQPILVDPGHGRDDHAEFEIHSARQFHRGLGFSARLVCGGRGRSACLRPLQSFRNAWVGVADTGCGARQHVVVDHFGGDVVHRTHHHADFPRHGGLPGDGQHAIRRWLADDSASTAAARLTAGVGRRLGIASGPLRLARWMAG